MEAAMQDHVYKLTEIVGTSHEGNDAAIKAALARAHKSIRNIRWFEVIGSRGFIEADGAVQYQVTLKVGFTLED
jgi:flavin-binding protein dodecin